MEETSAFGALNYSIFFIYLAAIFGIGLLLAGKQKTTEDYFLAGRKMPWFIVAMSMFTSLTSATSYMGIPGTAYKENISLIIVGVMSVIGAPVMIFLFYPFYRRLNVTTSYEYINRRYGRNARFATSGLFILARLGWLGVVIYSPALALSVVTGINLYFAIFIMGVLATSYTVLGGLSAVLWTDALQFIILVGGAIWVAVTLMMNVPDGLSGIMTIARESGHLDIFNFDLNLFENECARCRDILFFTGITGLRDRPGYGPKTDGDKNIWRDGQSHARKFIKRSVYCQPSPLSGNWYVCLLSGKS